MNEAAANKHSGRLGALFWLGILASAAILTALIVRAFVLGAAAEHRTQASDRPLWSIIPFAGILLGIALLPLVPRTQHWWEHNRNKLVVALTVASAMLLYYLWADGVSGAIAVLHRAVLDEYVPFMMLLFSLYVISGGISLRGDLPAHPATNTAFLAAGSLIASVVGTTGASMLLIRPLLQTNSERRHVSHTVIFFIFLVSNVGGCLLPIGDPPLFLGYLKGVPFTWTLGLWKEWAFCTAILLAIYYLWDLRAYRTEAPRDISRDEAVRVPLVLRGKINFIWLAGVVLCVAFVDPHNPLPLVGRKPPLLTREVFMLAFVGLSLITTPAGVRAANRFNYVAILEVAALFIGIFIAMQAPIEILNARGPELGLKHPWQFFWATGILSSFLDNAPTYVVFFETADALTHAPGPGVMQLLAGQFIREDLLVAISLGAVFMGANSYIGNGPNFMVKSIAEQAGVRMPSFFGYMLYSSFILLPVFVLVTLLFVR
ncbi:MAG TPA: sodium:proton antiporter [Phycisphaerae bacterium]